MSAPFEILVESSDVRAADRVKMLERMVQSGILDEVDGAIAGDRDSGRGPSSMSVWLGPQRLAALFCPPANHYAIAVRRAVLEKIGPPQRVENRLWDWLIRATRQGAAFSGPFHAGNDGREPGDLPALAPSRPARESNWLLNHLREFDPAELVSSPPPVAAATLRAGLYQWHDYLDESHQASQSIEGEGEQQFGDYWHAIMHRREPDYGNAKYWFRQLGPHALHRPLRERAAAILGDCGAPEAARWLDRLQPGLKWDPFAFVDLCEACAGDESAPLALAARRIQFEEMSLLMSLTLEPFRGPKASDAKRP